jgi:lipoate-protein ligase A
LWGDLARITDVLVYSDDQTQQDAAVRLLSHATTVESVLRFRISWDAAANALIEGFQSELDLELVQDELSEPEKIRAEQLMQEKYCHPSWLERI